MLIGTHAGRFHTDEVCAIATLLLIYPDAQVIRVRRDDTETLAKCDIRVDVGKKYDPTTGDFDHHQGGLEARKNGIGYASFGLIWLAFGQKLAGDERTVHWVDKMLVQAIDARDTGQAKDWAPAKKEGTVPPFQFAEAINFMNPTWDEVCRDSDEAFLQAVDMAKIMIQRTVAWGQSSFRAKPYVQQAVREMQDKRLLVLERACAWMDVVIKEAPSIKFVLYPDDDGDWRVQAVPVTHGSQQLRLALPEAWVSESATIAQISGVADATFIHQARYICGARSREGALRLAQLALGGRP